MKHHRMTVIGVFGVFAVIVAGLGPASGRAQDRDALTPASFLPRGSVLGEGWYSEANWSPSEEVDGTVDTRIGLYVGPEGSRAYVLATRIEQGASASRATWAIVLDSWFAAYVERIDQPQTRGQSAMPERAIDGCDEIERAWGYDRLDGLPVGIIQCAVGDDIIVITFVSNKLGPNSGGLAADRLMAILLARAGVGASATPAA